MTERCDTCGMAPCACPEECETCGGDGVIVHETYRGAHDIESEEQCPDCGGSGMVDDDGPCDDDRPLPTEDTTGLKDGPL